MALNSIFLHYNNQKSHGKFHSNGLAILTMRPKCKKGILADILHGLFWKRNNYIRAITNRKICSKTICSSFQIDSVYYYIIIITRQNFLLFHLFMSFFINILSSSGMISQTTTEYVTKNVIPLRISLCHTPISLIK